MWVPATAARDGSALPGAWANWDTPDTMPDLPNSGSHRKGQPAGLGNQAKIQAQWLTPNRSEEHTSELQSLMRISYAVFCLKKKKQQPRVKTPEPPHSTR